MSEWDTVDDVISFAISEEDGAVAFYTDLAGMADNDAMREALKGFAREEQAHSDKLKKIREGGSFEPSEQKVVDLKLSDYMVDIVPAPDMSYADILVVAMKKEASAFKLYTALAEVVTDETVKTVFLSLAREEAKHKLRFETEYDDYLARIDS